MPKQRRHIKRRARKATRTLFDKLSARLEAFPNTGAIESTEMSPFGLMLQPHSGLIAPLAIPTAPKECVAIPEAEERDDTGVTADSTRRLKTRSTLTTRLALLGRNAPTDYNITPKDMGLLAWSGDPAGCIGNINLTAGAVYLTRIRLAKASDIARIYIYLDAELIAAQNITVCCGVYNAARILLTQSIPQILHAATCANQGSPRSFALPQSVRLTPGLYTVALHVTGGASIFRLACTTLHRGFACLTHSEELRFAISKTGQERLPQQIFWADYLPGQGYWFGLGE